MILVNKYKFRITDKTSDQNAIYALFERHYERINTTRLMAINTFVEEFRGWEDESPDLPDEVKVINVTSDIYKKQIVNSTTPWILAFIKR